MTRIRQLCDFLDRLAPTRLAEDWDNVGLLVGDAEATVERVMTCLTITPDSAREALARQAELIVAHHPLPFRPLKKLTTEETSTRLLWELIRGGISIYSPHTGFDSAADGINQSICSRLGIDSTQPLIANPNETQPVGGGRWGQLGPSASLRTLLAMIKEKFGIEKIQYCGDLERSVAAVGAACGSGGSFLSHAVNVGCDVLITGEATFHTCLEAEARNVALVLMGHYASERFAIEMMAERIQTDFPDLEIWPSTTESDPVKWD